MAKKDIFDIPDEKILNLFFEQQRNKTLVILQNRLALSLSMMLKTSIKKPALRSIRTFKVEN